MPRRPNAVAPRGDVDDDEIRRLYCDEHRSGAEISNLPGCSAGLVYFGLARLGIERRSPVAERRGPSDDELAHLYTERGLSLRTRSCAGSVSFAGPQGELNLWKSHAEQRVYLAEAIDFDFSVVTQV